MKSNKKKAKEKQKKQSAEFSTGRFGRATQEVLGGGIFESERSFRMFPFLIYLAFLAFVYISVDYMAEGQVRKIGQLEKEVKELRYEYVSVKSNLMSISKQSQLEKRLERLGIKENNEPVKVIHIKQKKEN
jgi:cell division protein FtsL